MHASSWTAGPAVEPTIGGGLGAGGPEHATSASASASVDARATTLVGLVPERARENTATAAAAMV